MGRTKQGSIASQGVQSLRVSLWNSIMIGFGFTIGAAIASAVLMLLWWLFVGAAILSILPTAPSGSGKTKASSGAMAEPSQEGILAASRIDVPAWLRVSR